MSLSLLVDVTFDALINLFIKSALLNQSTNDFLTDLINQCIVSQWGIVGVGNVRQPHDNKQHQW